MATITGTIIIDFETDKHITDAQFKGFKQKLNKLIEDWEMMVYDVAFECGFEADSVHPILLDDIECDFDDME